MSDRYDFQAIEAKWRQRWSEADAFAVSEDKDRKKYYVLEMLPYPSGALHMGHVRNYSLGDSIARYRTMQGYNVLHPIGWDAFGLPAENAAIRHKVPAWKWTFNNIAKMKEQCRALGFAYDWSREITTCRAEFYRWNQWFFLQMYRRGLAYRKQGLVNWCRRCQTVLANEQVVNGACWRDGSPVVQKELEQWYLRITQYADELLDDLETLAGWPEKVVTMQRNWIGKSTGTRVRFTLVEEPSRTIEVFTTRVDTIFGATFLVLAPEHPQVQAWAARNPELAEFARRLTARSREARIDETAEKVGMFTGKCVVNPYSDEKVPVWVANFVLMEYGTGAIMAVPAHDCRDFEFAQKYELPIRTVIEPLPKAEPPPGGEAFVEKGILVDSGVFSGMFSEDAIERMTELAVEKGFGEKQITYRLRDWGISRQRYWGTPIPVIYCPGCGTVPVPEEHLPVLLPEMEAFEPGGSPLGKLESFVAQQCPQCGNEARRETDTMDTFVDSAWYFYRYTDAHNEDAPYRRDIAEYWLPVDLYIGGIEHAVLHLIYMRFFTKVMRDLGLIGIDEPVAKLFTQGMVIKDGAKMSKSLGNVVVPDRIVSEYGADTLRLFIQFCAPPDGELDWNDRGLEGCQRFLNRYWRLLAQFAEAARRADGLDESAVSGSEQTLIRKLHQTIRKVTADLERFHQNTAIAAIMELQNSVYEYVDQGKPNPSVLKRVLETTARLLAPFAPHLAAEAAEMLGSSLDRWPDFDAELAREHEIAVVVQVNGKVRSRFSVVPGVSREEMEKAALADEKVQTHLEGRSVRKIIVVPEKLVNIVVGS